MFATRLIINKIIKVQWVNFKLENVLVSLHSLKPMGLGSIIFKEWRVTRTFSYTEWIPRDLNVQADFYSKIFDFDDWSVALHMFCFFNQKWGPFSIDKFADSNNHRLDNFNSRFWTPGSKGVDAFAFDWSKDNNWLVPPIHLVYRVLNHLRICKGTGVLIVPFLAVIVGF